MAFLIIGKICFQTKCEVYFNPLPELFLGHCLPTGDSLAPEVTTCAAALIPNYSVVPGPLCGAWSCLAAVGTTQRLTSSALCVFAIETLVPDLMITLPSTQHSFSVLSYFFTNYQEVYGLSLQ